MEDVRVITVSCAKEEEIFFALPWEIYAHEPLWVGPLKREERTLLTPGKHPFWEKGKRELFLAMRGSKAIGRIAAIIDYAYNDNAKEKCGAWGFFECYEDEQAAHALFDAVASWHRQHGMHFMRGPLSPSVNYTCAMLVGGFELSPAIMMPWNFAYYPKFAESWNMYKEQDLFAYTFYKNAFNVSQHLKDQIQIIKDRNEFTWRKARKKHMLEDIRTMLDIFKVSWRNNWGYSPMSVAEADMYTHSLKKILNPDFFVLFYHKDEAIAGMVALPDLNPLLKRLQGSIGPLVPWHWWKTRKHLRSTYRLVLFGIKDEYQRMGVPLLLLNYLLELGNEHPYFSTVEGSWSLEDNNEINDMIEDFGGTMTKRYRIYRKELEYQCL